MAKQPRWREQKGCRTCRFMSASDEQRSYRPPYTFRCLYPADQLPWPVLPFSLSAAYGVTDDLDRLKSGRAKKAINIRDDGEGVGCPTWEKWTP
jgi:hypothetical protein